MVLRLALDLELGLSRKQGQRCPPREIEHLHYLIFVSLHSFKKVKQAN